MLQLLVLLQSRPSWRAAELADRMGVSSRTLRRDLGRLADLGYAVHSQTGPGGHYRLGGGTRMPPFVLDDEEVIAVVAALRMAEESVGGDAAARVLVKLRQVLPRRLADIAADVVDHSEAVTRTRNSPALPDLSVLGLLTAAAAGDRAVRFAYTDQDGERSDRFVDSVRCLSTGGRWYLVGHDRGRGAWRVFRLDRVRNAVTDDRESPRRSLPAADLAEWFATDFGRAPLKAPSATPAADHDRI